MKFGWRERIRVQTASLALVVVALSAYFCLTTQGQQPTARVTRVLFIGNSYTYFNDLPELFTKLAESGLQGKVETRMVAPGGWRLKDHWEKGEARKALREAKWDYVVLQDQSTLGVSFYLDGKPRVTSDEVFKPYAEKWAAEVRQAGATPVFYLTWARKATPDDQVALNYAYIHAAKESGALVAPVGIAWDHVRRQQPAEDLYYRDGSHPSPAGSYLAACEFYATVFHKTPLGLPAKVNGIPVNLETEQREAEKTAVLVDLPADEARILQSAAWSAAEQLAEHGGYLDVSPAPTPSPAPLARGTTLSAAKLDGVWTGKLLFYPAGPADMSLRFHNEGDTCKARLELKFNVKNVADESFDITDLDLKSGEFSFTDPKGMDGLKLRFRGAITADGELVGTAEATKEIAEPPPIRVLGDWRLRKN